MDEQLYPYEDKYFSQIKEWLTKRKMPSMPVDALPDTGFVVDQTACGFLLLTNSNIGVLEYFITNPEADRVKRKKAIISIAERLLQKAKKLECKAISCRTQSRFISETASHLGFKDLGLYRSFFKEI